MPGHHHNPTAGTQNQGNSLGDRSSVRQSRLYRQYESGNDVKGLLGTGHLQWRLDQTEGAYKGKKTFDHNHVSSSSSSSSPSKQAEAAARLKAQMLHDELQQQQKREENILSLARRSNAMYDSQQLQRQQPQPVRRPAPSQPTRALPRFRQEEEDELSQLRERLRHLDALEAAEAEADARRGRGSEEEEYLKYVNRADLQYLRSDAYIGPERRGGSLNPRQEEARDPSDYSNQPDRARGARNNYEQPQPHPPRRRYHEDEEDEEDEEAREYSRLPRRRDQPPAAHAQQERWQRERERERERQREVMEAEEREILERQRRLKAEIEMLQKISSNTAGPIGRLVKQEPPFALSPSKEDEDRGRRGRPRLGALSSHLQQQQQQQQPLVLVQSAQERRSMEQTRSTRPW